MQEKIDEILTRSVSKVYPTKESLKEALLSGKKLRIYSGIDPTAPYVHLGHATNYFLLRRLHSLGHKIIILVGDFTAMMGDPSDKNAARKRLSKEDVLENLKTFKNQIGKIINFEDKENPVEFRFNAEWLSKLNFEEVVDLSSHFTVQQMIERDVFQKRLNENKPLYIHEFLYPLMQGYDSVALEADVEVGGTDQTFNMLAGRSLVKSYQNREKFVITTNLLENPLTGEKLMSKSLGTGIGLNEEADSMFGKIMAMPDESIIQLFIDCTDLPMEKINNYAKDINNGRNPKEVKMELGSAIVEIFHGQEASIEAAKNFNNAFSLGEFPENAEIVNCSKDDKLSDLFVQKEIVPSKSEFRRLIEAGAISDHPDQKITDPNETVGNKERKIRIGKKSFVILKPE